MIMMIKTNHHDEKEEEEEEEDMATSLKSINWRIFETSTK